MNLVSPQPPTSTVLVVGGAGYIGATTCHHLRRGGYTPVILDNFSKGHRSFADGFPLVEADVLDEPAVVRALRDTKATAVVHFAAYTEVGLSMREPLDYYRVNVAGTISLLRAMKQAGLGRIVFSSSAAVYGTPDEVPIPVGHRLRPINPYGHTKVMMEQMMRDAATAHGLSSIALRYFNAAGADEELPCGEWHDPESHLIPNALRAAAGLKPHLELFGTDHPTPDGTAVRDYIHVADLARAHVAALGRLESAPLGFHRAYNLGLGRGFSVREVIAAAERVAGRPITVIEKPIRAGDPPALVASADAARDELGWLPDHTDLDVMVGSAWRWYARHGFSAPMR